MSRLKKNKSVFVESLSPTGHTQFNEVFLQMLACKSDVFFVGKSLKDKIKFNGLKKIFNDKNLHEGRIKHYICCLKNCLKSVYEAKKIGAENIYLFSYDILTIPIISIICFLCGIKIYTFEHNTVHYSGLKKWIQLLTINVTRLCFTPAANEIYKSIGQKTHLISLPIIERTDYMIGEEEEEEEEEEVEDYVFCPSGSVKISDILKFATKSEPVIFYVKSEKKIHTHGNIITRKYYDSYESMIKSAKAVYVPILSNERMSGPVIDAISFLKPVIMRKSELSIYLSNVYKGFIYFDDSNIQDTLKSFKDGEKINIDHINKKLKEQLNEIRKQP